MIRKRVGDEFRLITQQDHAALAAALAAAIGNRQFSPAGSENVVRAVAVHDDGWADADAGPLLDVHGLPADVFHTPRAVEHAAWLASARKALAAGPYAGLLVALHQLSLSAYAAGQSPGDRFDDEQRRRQFDLNKIQHALIEQIEMLRATLGLAVDRPLRLGLADGWTSAEEESLRFDFRLLQACDALSLHACCDALPPSVVPQPLPRPGSQPVTLAVTHAPGAILVRPWPFAKATVSARVPYRAVQALAYASADALRAAYAAAQERAFDVTFRAG